MGKQNKDVLIASPRKPLRYEIFGSKVIFSCGLFNITCRYMGYYWIGLFYRSQIAKNAVEINR